MSAWIDQLFDAAIVKKDGLVRRKVADVKKYASEKELVAEVKKRGFHLVETGKQYVVLCNVGAMKIWC